MQVQNKPFPISFSSQSWDFDIFLSYNRLDLREVEQLAQALFERGFNVFKDDWHLKPGGNWPIVLERKIVTSKAVVVAIGRHGFGSWQQREVVVALDHQGRESKAGRSMPPVIPVLLEKGCNRHAGLHFLLQNTWVENWDARAPDLIAGAVRGQAPIELYDEAYPDPRTFICPYRGLGFFREEDDGFYFGREQDLKHLIAAVALHPLVGIVGPSGSGKSSLARAGLIPQLRRQTDRHVWQVADMLPGTDPFLALARALLPLREPNRILNWSKGEIDDQCERLKTRLERDGSAHLSHVVAQILEEEPGTTLMLLLIDQWEELYTYRPTGAVTEAAHAEQMRRFTSMLLETICGQTLRVVFTLRADYWGEVLNDQPLTARLPEKAIIHLRTLERTALEDVIRKPAEITGLKVPEDLVEALVVAATDQAGDLALLEFTLQQLWSESERSGKGSLSFDAYHGMGGMEKAIVNLADEVFTRLDRNEQEAVPGVFAALIQVGELRTDLRRRARLAELSEVGQAVARRFADERLLVTSRDWVTGDDLIEVAHEALLRHWPRLETWVDTRRDALLTMRQLQMDSHSWIQNGRNSSYLWSYERVREAIAALAQVGPEIVLSAEEQAFLGPVEASKMLNEIIQPMTTHRRRLLIGERLDLIGDERRGVGLRSDDLPDIKWCQIEGGDVQIEILSDRLDPKSDVIGTLSNTVESFAISLYTITSVQYRAFLKANDGWREPEWWADNLCRESAGDSYDLGRFDNHPAVYVSWFDAMAYCRWLSLHLGYTVSLPTEFEWQQAATGGNIENSFPWGPDWEPKHELHRANTFESRLARMTAVGMYPACASQAGPLDMAGTVWEWCLNKFDAPNVTDSHADDHDPRVVRGGSWFDYQDFARCAYRNWYYPLNRGIKLGFRIICPSNKNF